MRRKVYILLAVPALFLLSIIFLMSDIKAVSQQNDELLNPEASKSQRVVKPFPATEPQQPQPASDSRKRERDPLAPEESNTSPSERLNSGANHRLAVEKRPHPRPGFPQLDKDTEQGAPLDPARGAPLDAAKSHKGGRLEQILKQAKEKTKEEEAEEEAMPQKVEEMQEPPKQINTGAGFGNEAPAGQQSINEPKKVVGEQKSGGTSSDELRVRAEAVKNAYLHAWNSYKKSAWGHDELKPLSHTSQDWLNMGLSIVDSIDTMYLMDLQEPYQEARAWIASSLSFDSLREVSFFETTIRVVGGLVSIYDLTGDSMYIEKAEKLAKKLMPAFNTPTGIPFTTINLQSGNAINPHWAGGASILSEAGTVQMEYTTLSRHTNNPEYGKKAVKVFDQLDSMSKPDGLYPVYINQNSGIFTRNHVTLGALGDSFYEYLLKMYLLTDKKEAKYQRMYESAANAIINKLVKKSSPTGLTYIAEWIDGRIESKMDHLVCFAGAMFALGAYHNVTDKVDEHMRLGKEITRTCHETYARQASGLGPELVRFQDGNDFYSSPGSNHYILRPETVESYYVLWWITGDPMYQEWGWDAFQAIEKHCRTPDGYAGVRDVSTANTQNDDLQQSFFMAETLKYLYLLFAPRSTLSLDEYVFNTEAHPIKIWK